MSRTDLLKKEPLQKEKQEFVKTQQLSKYEFIKKFFDNHKVFNQQQTPEAKHDKAIQPSDSLTSLNRDELKKIGSASLHSRAPSQSSANSKHLIGRSVARRRKRQSQVDFSYINRGETEFISRHSNALSRHSLDRTMQELKSKMQKNNASLGRKTLLAVNHDLMLEYGLGDQKRAKKQMRQDLNSRAFEYSKNLFQKLHA